MRTIKVKVRVLQSKFIQSLPVGSGESLLHFKNPAFLGGEGQSYAYIDDTACPSLPHTS
jgi:hypothetical protein